MREWPLACRVNLDSARGSVKSDRSTTGLGTNGWGAYSHLHVNVGGAFLAEVILTAFFVFAVLGVGVTSFVSATQAWRRRLLAAPAAMKP